MSNCSSLHPISSGAADTLIREYSNFCVANWNCWSQISCEILKSKINVLISSAVFSYCCCETKIPKSHDANRFDTDFFFTGILCTMSITGWAAAPRCVRDLTREVVTTTAVQSTASWQSSGPGPTARPAPRNRQETHKSHRRPLTCSLSYCSCVFILWWRLTQSDFIRHTDPAARCAAHTTGVCRRRWESFRNIC